MINTSNQVMFVAHGTELDRYIRESLRDTSDAIKVAYNLQNFELRSVSTKTYPILGFSKFVELGILKASVLLGEDYVKNLFSISQQSQDAISRNDFVTFFPLENVPNLSYKRAYSTYLKKAFGLFLLSMHTKRAIILPMVFNWPTSKVSKDSTRASQIVCESSELLSFLRSVETASKRDGIAMDPAFYGIVDSQKRLEWFSTYSTKVLLATGWHMPEEIDLKDMLALNRAQQSGKGMIAVSVFGELAKILATKYQGRIRYDNDDIYRTLGAIKSLGGEEAIKTKASSAYEELAPTACSPDQTTSVINRRKRAGVSDRIGMPEGSELSSIEHFSRLLKCPAAMAHTRHLPSVLENAEGNFDFSENLGYWVELENAYLKALKRESYKGVHGALGLWNLYLFWYLPYWYLENPLCAIPFPSTPNRLNAAVFVSRLLKIDGDVPLTFMEFMNARTVANNNDSATLYAQLLQVELFFQWITVNPHRLRDSDSFVQPMSRFDYPNTPRSLGTNKVPLPRRFFSAFVAYFEILVDYCIRICELRFEGKVDDSQMEYLAFSSVNGMLDTVKCADIVGYIPIFFGNDGAVLPVRLIPALPKIARHHFTAGGGGLILHPHVVIQLFVGVLTGIRHNHIQWFDADEFDSRVKSDDVEFTELFVNTDKTKNMAWVGVVNFKVIDILRKQLEWRNSILAYGFSKKHFYNDNEWTKYRSFRPLFSFNADGRPHSDKAYSTYWRRAIEAFQTILPNLVGQGERIPLLGRRVRVDGKSLDGGAPAGAPTHSARTKFVTEITPHSSRVSVVSDFIRYLPAEFIGRFITGQSSIATVYHYVVPDPDDLGRAQVHQAMDQRKRAEDQRLKRVIGPDPSASPHIRADEVNSNIARSMKVNVTETLARYGCISLSIDSGTSGLDILKHEGDVQAAYNKTEICPFGNNCPDWIVKLLRGWRRCSICPAAVRSIDHLPAACVKQKQVAETLQSQDARISEAMKLKSYSNDELQEFEADRQRIAEDLAGWTLCVEVLHTNLLRVAAGERDKKWIVEQPEILARGLQRVAGSMQDADYLLVRLDECISYKGFDSPEISRGFERLTRTLLAKSGGSLEEVLAFQPAVDAAAECAGMLRSVVELHQLTFDDVKRILTTDSHLKLSGRREIMRFADAV